MSVFCISFYVQLMSNLNKLPPSTPCGNGRNQLSFFTTAVFPAIEKAIQGEPREAQRQMETFCLARLNNPRYVLYHIFMNVLLYLFAVLLLGILLLWDKTCLSPLDNALDSDGPSLKLYQSVRTLGS